MSSNREEPMRTSGTAILDRPVALTLTPEGRPHRLEWHAHVFLVTDAPTPLETTLGLVLTHPLPVQGWRFQGTRVGDGEARVFDVVRCEDGWRVVKTYA
jgi:hypothetical protein